MNKMRVTALLLSTALLFTHIAWALPGKEEVSLESGREAISSQEEGAFGEEISPKQLSNEESVFEGGSEESQNDLEEEQPAEGPAGPPLEFPAESSASDPPFEQSESSLDEGDSGAELKEAKEGLFQEGALSGEQLKPRSTALRSISNEKRFEEKIVSALKARKASISVYEFGLDGVQDYEGDPAEIGRAYFKVLNSHPELFYVEGTIGWSIRNSIASTIYFHYKYDEDTSEEMQEEYEDAIDYARRTAIHDGMTDEEKVLAVHDHLALHTKYDYDIALDPGNGDVESYSAYGILVKGLGVCNGYALAMVDILKREGIPVLFVAAEEMNHAWNVVQLDGKWYHVDATWDDPVWVNGTKKPATDDYDKEGYVQHKRVLLSDTEMERQGYSEWDEAIPECKSDRYKNYYWKDITSGMFYFNEEWYYARDNIQRSEFDGSHQVAFIQEDADFLALYGNRIYFTDGGRYVWSAPLNNPQQISVEIKISTGTITELSISRNTLRYVVKNGSNYSLHQEELGEPEAPWFSLKNYYYTDDDKTVWGDSLSEDSDEPSTIKLNRVDYLLDSNFIAPDFSIDRIEFSELQNLDRVEAVYDETLKKILVSICATEIGQNGSFNIKIGNFKKTYYVTTEGALHISGTGSENEFMLPIAGEGRTLYFRGDLLEEGIAWNLERSRLTGDASGQIAKFSFTRLEDDTLALSLTTKPGVEIPEGSALNVVLMDEERRLHSFPFYCSTVEPGIGFYEYVYDDDYQFVLPDYESPILISTDPARPTELDRNNGWEGLLTVDGNTIAADHLDKVKISSMSEEFQATLFEDRVAEQGPLILWVQSPVQRKKSALTVSVDGTPSKTFYFSTMGSPQIYHDESCTIPIDEISLPLFGESMETVYIKGAEIGANAEDGTPIDWRSIADSISVSTGVVDRIEADYLEKDKAIKLTLYRDERKPSEDNITVWASDGDHKFRWVLPYRLISGIYIAEREMDGDFTSSETPVTIELRELETQYFAILNAEREQTGFRVVETQGDGFEWSTIEIDGKTYLTVDALLLGGDEPNSITLENAEGVRHTYPIIIQEAKIKAYSDPELTNRIWQLDFFENTIRKCYLVVEGLSADELEVSHCRFTLNHRGTGQLLKKIKNPELVQVEGTYCFEVELQAPEDSVMQRPGSIEFVVYPLHGNELRQTYRYWIHPQLTSDYYHADFEQRQLSGLEVGTTVEEMSDNLTVLTRYRLAVMRADSSGQMRQLQGGDLVGTGCEIRYCDEKGRTLSSLTALLYGDCYGDGKIDVFDLLEAKRHILGISRLDGIYAAASDTTRDGEINVFDMLEIKKSILGISRIDQSK